MSFSDSFIIFFLFFKLFKSKILLFDKAKYFRNNLKTPDINDEY